MHCGTSIESIANDHKRSKGAIISRLTKIAVCLIHQGMPSHEASAHVNLPIHVILRVHNSKVQGPTKPPPVQQTLPLSDLRVIIQKLIVIMNELDTIMMLFKKEQ